MNVIAELSDETADHLERSASGVQTRIAAEEVRAPGVGSTSAGSRGRFLSER